MLKQLFLGGIVSFLNFGVHAMMTGGVALLTRGAAIADYWRDGLHSLKGLPNVIDIRNIGLMGAVEVAPRKDGVGTRGYDVMVDCFNRGLYLRMSGDSFALSPPLIVERSQIDDIVSILGDALKHVA